MLELCHTHSRSLQPDSRVLNGPDSDTDLYTYRRQSNIINITITARPRSALVACEDPSAGCSSPTPPPHSIGGKDSVDMATDALWLTTCNPCCGGGVALLATSAKHPSSIIVLRPCVMPIQFYNSNWRILTELTDTNYCICVIQTNHLAELIM